MDAPLQLALRRGILSLGVAAVFCGASGCAEWMTNTTPGDLWERVTPDKQTWESMSPSNLWAKMGRLNYQDEGLSSDVYD